MVSDEDGTRKLRRSGKRRLVGGGDGMKLKRRVVGDGERMWKLIWRR